MKQPGSRRGILVRPSWPALSDSNHTDEIFGTHSPPICGCDRLAGDGDWTTISIAKAPMTGAEGGNEVIQIDYNAEVQKGRRKKATVDNKSYSDRLSIIFEHPTNA